MNWISTLVFSLTVFSLAAQYDGKDPDIASRHRPGIMWYFTGFKPPGRNSAPKYDRLMADVHYDSWDTGSGLQKVKPLSIGFNFHMMFDIPLAPRNIVGLGLGLSFRHQRISFDGILDRDAVNRATKLVLTPAGAQSPEKSVFASDAFAIPLELRFRTPQWKHVKLHIGAHAGYRTRVYTKLRMAGDDRTSKSKDFFDEERFFYGVHARIGVRNWAFFADYGLNPQFTSGQSTKLNPVTFGITVSLF